MIWKELKPVFEKYRDSGEEFEMYLARIDKLGRLFCSKHTFRIDCSFDYPRLECLDGTVSSMNLHDKNSRDKMTIKTIDDTFSRALGRTKEEALDFLKKSISLRIEKRLKDIENCKAMIESSKSELVLVDNYLKE